MLLKCIYIFLFVAFIGTAGQSMFFGIQNFHQHDPLNGFLNFLLIPIFLFIALIVLFEYENEFNVNIFPTKKRKSVQEMTQAEYDKAIRRLNRKEKIKNIISFLILFIVFSLFMFGFLYELIEFLSSFFRN